MSDNMAYSVFGDQSLDTFNFLEDLCRRPEQGLLAKSFLEKAAAALRREVDQLSVVDRNSLPIFTTIAELNEKYHSVEKKHTGLDSALLCTAQLAHFIDRAESAPEDALKELRASILGLCTGLFAATAVTIAPNLPTLTEVGAQVVLMAFRTGQYVSEMADRIYQSHRGSEPWTFVVPGLTFEEAEPRLQTLQDEKNIPKVARVYISAVAPNSLSISGPPSTLKTLFNSDLAGLDKLPIPITGPYHAPHLHSSCDVTKLLRLEDSNVKAALAECSPRSRLMSSTTGKWLESQSCEDLLQQIAKEILCERLDFQKMIDGCVADATAAGATTCNLSQFGPSSGTRTLAKALTEKNLTANIVKNAYEKTKVSRGYVDRCKLAIVGMAGRFPDAATHEKLWELLEKGIDAHRIVPADRFPSDTHVDVTGKARNTSHTPYGCWIENPGLFDPRFFNMSPREAFQTDPMQRMALTTAYEALEMAGYVPNRTRSTKLDRIGTFYGQTSDDWREINAAQDVDTYYITGGVRAFGPGRINYLMGFSGPSFNIDTACSSSAAALQLACTSLWAEDCDTAVVGGLSCMTNSDIFAGLSRGQFLSKNGPCSTFDNDADGYCRADGCATVIVKRLEDAVADKDNVLAVILGTATNHSADAISITHPHGGTQEKLYRQILAQAGVDPLDVDYVEMHGTGTQAGDGTEMKSVTNVFAPANRKRSADQPLYLGAVKANVGHGEAASGVTALVKVLMMLEKNAIPPHVGIKGEINKGFPKDLAERNVNIAFKRTALPRKPNGPRRVFVNNFSAAGGNTGLLLEDGPIYSAAAEDSRTTQLVTVTAKSKSALANNVQRLLAYLDANPQTTLADLAYSTTARRIQHNWRLAIPASDIAQFKADVQSKASGNLAPIAPTAPKVAFLFTGQGSHYAALGKEFYENFGVFQRAIDEFDRLGQMFEFPSFMPLIDGSEPDVQSLSPVVVQLGLCCFEMAMAKLWVSWGVKPAVVLGHSLGEYAALHVAGILSASDTIYLVGKRAEALVAECTAGTHAMLAVQGPVSTVTEGLKSRNIDVNVACINGPRETVLSGEAAQMEEVANELTEAGFKCTQLKVPFAFHSAQVEPILESFEKLAQAVTFNKAELPVISPLFGRMLGEDELVNPEYLRRHAREAVDFLGGLVSAQEKNVIDEKTVWIEVGPHPVCLGMVKAAFGAATTSAPSLRRNENAWKTLSNSLAALYLSGVSIDWNEHHRDFADSVRLLNLPTYAFDEKNYWIQYEHDWCLHKGRFDTPIKGLLQAPRSKLSTSSVHEVVQETVKGDAAHIVTETDLLRDDLRQAVMGHLVNGSPLCPSSIYADMALTVAEYGYRLVRPDSKMRANVSHMEVTKPIIADPKLSKQILTLTCDVDAARGRAVLKLTTTNGKTVSEHASTTVIYGTSEEWLQEWRRSSYLIQSRIDWLQEAERSGVASKVARGLAYKLFAAGVDYDRKFQGMEEVILHSANYEATSRVVFQTKPQDGTFVCSPYWIDSLAHLSGFILNGSDATDSRANCYISHGWESMRFAEDLSVDKTYRAYVRMQDIGKNMLAGDVFVFDGDRVIGMVGGLKFQCIPRRLMDMLMPPIGAAAKSTAAPAKAVKAAPAARPQKKKENAQVNSKNLAAVNKKLASVTGQALDILASEIGVDRSELDDNIVVADMGVDSLMSLSVSGRFREELELDIPSTVFVEHSTIGAFKKFLAQFESTDAGAVSDSSMSSEEDGSTPDTDESAASDITTPDDEAPESNVKGSELIDLIKNTIAEEMGVEVDEVVSCSNLADIGLDSLMSLSILGTLREKTEVSLPADLLVANPSIKEIEMVLGIGAPEKPAPKPRQAAPKSSKSEVQSAPERSATSVLLQGSSRTATKNVFIFPDGGGSATSYKDITDLGDDVAMWGLNSPFMKTPDEFTCGIEGMANHYIKEMKRRQPEGPYILAGWSAGGVIGFEAVNQLSKAGEVVSNLILLDSPCPNSIEPLPESLHKWFAEAGVLGDPSGDTTKLPSWLLPHFAASVRALGDYNAVPIESERCPNITAIWCEEGVCSDPEAPRPDPYPTGHALFLLEKKPDFNFNGWDSLLLNHDKFACRHTSGNHFTMMKGENGKKVGQLIKEAITM